jgi:hypothetical protein
MTTPTSRFVSMIPHTYTLKPVIDAPSLVGVHALDVRSRNNNMPITATLSLYSETVFRQMNPFANCLPKK